MTRQEEVEALLRAFAGRDVAAIRALGEAEIDLDAPGGGGLTVLMRAILRGDAVTVEWILAAGADPDAPSGDGRTALDLARSLGRLDLAELLLAAGAAGKQSLQASLALGERSASAAPCEPSAVAAPPAAAPSLSGDTFSDGIEDVFEDRFDDLAGGGPAASCDG